jgi:beta-N-acetylhexosaminidase
VILIVAVLGGGFYALVHFGVITLPSMEATEAPSDSFVVPTLTPTPSVVPTEAPTEPDYVAMAQRTAASMTDREKFLQLIITTPETLTGVDAVNMAGETTKNAIESYPVGGIIYSDVNFEDVNQTKELLEKSQSFAKTPMFLAVDEEGGDVARVASKLGTKSFESMYTYKDQGIQTAHDNAMDIASDLSSLGFNLDFAPVADTFTNPENTVIGTRAYSDSYDEAARLVASAVTGFHNGGVLCTLKHFPGHGAATEDSHLELAHIDKTAEELTSGELIPFKNGIDAGADMVMVGHLVVTHLDDELPATLSPKVVPSLLRELYHYDGVVITDSMQMAAITDNFNHETIVKGIFDADIDMILMPDDLDSYLESFEKLLAEGSITREQLDRKVIRVLSLKYQKGIIPTASGASSEAPSEPATNAVTETAAIPDETLAEAA